MNIQIQNMHRQAMEFADQAFVAKLNGDKDQACELWRRAFDLERDAALAVAGDLSAEPTRSILLRSAASLAMDCGEMREAERLITMALSGYPPQEIAEELRDLYEQVNFQRHLETRGIVLDPTEFQFSIIGNAVSYGMALADQFFERVESLEKLIRRTAERVRGKAFSERGRPEKAITEGFALFVSVPSERSFAVSFRVGSSEQLLLPGLEAHDAAVGLIDELLSCFELLNHSDEQALKERIPDPAYYRNFVGLSRVLAPDGEQVKQVGFTAIRSGKERRVALTKPQSEILPVEAPVVLESKKLLKAIEERIVVQGELRHADSPKSQEGRIWLVESDGTKREIIVPEGMMADIVKPLWEDTVEVTGMLTGKKIVLETIQRIDL
jgi:hypothetical protein